MTQPFDANEFRRQQMAAGQVPQGAPPAMPQGQPQQMQPHSQPMQQQPMPPQHPQGQVRQQPQYATQAYQAPMQQAPQGQMQAQRPPHQQQPRQAYAQPQQPQPGHFAPPQAVDAAPAEAKKSLFKRGPKTPKTPNAESGSQGRSPALVFTTGLLTGVLFTILGLKMIGQKAERPIVSAATAIQPGPAVPSSTVPGPNAPSPVHEPQIAPVGEVPSRPMPKPVTP